MSLLNLMETQERKFWVIANGGSRRSQNTAVVYGVIDESFFLRFNFVDTTVMMKHVSDLQTGNYGRIIATKPRKHEGGESGMKKIITLTILLLMVSSKSFGAVSDDVYVRKDVFDVHMQSINAKLDMTLEQIKELREEMKAQRQDINELMKAVSVMSGRIDGLDKRIDGVNASLSWKIDSVDKRIDDVRNGLYLWLVAIGLVVTIFEWPKVQDMFRKLGKSSPSITLEDVERLIDAKMAGKAQV